MVGQEGSPKALPRPWLASVPRALTDRWASAFQAKDTQLTASELSQHAGTSPGQQWSVRKPPRWAEMN